MENEEKFESSSSLENSDQEENGMRQNGDDKHQEDSSSGSISIDVEDEEFILEYEKDPEHDFFDEVTGGCNKACQTEKIPTPDPNPSRSTPVFFLTPSHKPLTEKIAMIAELHRKTVEAKLKAHNLAESVGICLASIMEYEMNLGTTNEDGPRAGTSSHGGGGTEEPIPKIIALIKEYKYINSKPKVEAEPEAGTNSSGDRAPVTTNTNNTIKFVTIIREFRKPCDETVHFNKPKAEHENPGTGNQQHEAVQLSPPIKKKRGRPRKASSSIESCSSKKSKTRKN